MLINPYNGCSVNCAFCYSQALPGYFQLFRQKSVVTVFRDFDRVVAHQLDGLSVASCGYLSPVTDPFQEIEQRYHLSEKLISVFLDRNLPIEFITKSQVPDKVIRRMASVPNCFGQISILTPEEEVRMHLMAGGATTVELFQQIQKLSDAGLPAVLRIDPVIPYVTDRPQDLSSLIQRAADSGARHVVVSVLDIPLAIAGTVWSALSVFGETKIFSLKSLYTEKIGSSLHATINYRKDLFSLIKAHCNEKGLTFALCMEYELRNGVPFGLNNEFMTTTNCEGMDIPIYIRHGDRFEPITSCEGACLNCKDPSCGIEDLALGRTGWKKPGFTLRDYRRWSRELARVGRRNAWL
jgi:DNA repair photolyase